MDSKCLPCPAHWPPADLGMNISLGFSSISAQNHAYNFKKGSLADRFGKKWFIVAGGVLGISGSIAAATADNTGTVIGAQVVNGIGASMIVSSLPTVF